jgi:hypothetical protein
MLLFASGVAEESDVYPPKSASFPDPSHNPGLSEGKRESTASVYNLQNEGNNLKV